MRFTFILTDGSEKNFSGITKIIKDGKNILPIQGNIEELFSGRLTVHYADGKIAFIEGDKVKHVLP